MSRLAYIALPLAVATSVAVAFFKLPNPAPALVLIGTAAGFVLWLWSAKGTAWRAAVLTEPADAAPPAPLLDAGWFLAGMGLLGAAFFLLEWQQPYYFTQDDALVCELPGMLVGCRGVWEGIWPNYNPYSCMGSPLANLGLYALTYPPTYLAYAISRHLLADEFATIDVLAILHLVAGYAVLFGLVRQQRGSSAVAALVGVCVVLSGSMLIMGRSWPAFVPLVVWLPTLAWGLVRLCQGPVGWLWTVAMGSAIGMTFHVGFPQMSLWVTGFFVVAVPSLVLLGQTPLRRAYLAAPALLLGIGLALPIALPQVRSGEGMGPRGGVGIGLPLPDAWVCMLVPFPLGQAPHPEAWGTMDREYFGQMYFFGGLLAALFFANALALFSFRLQERWWCGQFWFLAALATLLLMAGDAGGVWLLLRHLPVVGRVNNHPFRLLPFFVLFASLVGGLVLERTLRRTPRRHLWEAVLGIVVGGVLLYHVWLARPSFYTYPIRPYPALPAEMNAALGLPDDPTGRVMAWSALRSTHPDIGLSMFNALPSVYGMPAFQGYDPVVENTLPYKAAEHWLVEYPHEAARVYGLRWHLTVRGMGPVRSIHAGTNVAEEGPAYPAAFDVLEPLKLPAVFESGPILLTELDTVDPLAFIERHSDQPLPLRMRADGIDVDVEAAAGETVIVNFLWRPQTIARVDGLTIPCEQDDWLRMRVQIPAGGKKLELRFAPNWSQGLLLGATAILLAIGVKLWMRRIGAE